MELQDRTLEQSTSETPMDTAPLLHAAHIVREFLVYLKAHPIAETRLVDLEELPSPKGTLVNAFRLLIANERRMQQRSQLQKIGLLIAQFQPIDKPSDQEEPRDPLASWIDDAAEAKAASEQNWLSAYREHQELTELFDLSARMVERETASTDIAASAEQSIELRAH